MSKLLQITTAFILIGFLVFYGQADWSKAIWVDAWYLWTDICFMLLVSERIILIKNKKAKGILGVVLAAFTIRLIWEIVFFINPVLALCTTTTFLLWLIAILGIGFIVILTIKYQWLN